MEILLTKLAAFLVYPIGLFSLIMFIVLWLWIAGRSKSAVFFTTIAVVMVIAASLPVTSGYVAGYLEKQHPPIPIKSLPQVSTVVVLGGHLEPPRGPRLAIELSSTSDRLLHALRIFKAGKAKRIFLSGGNAFNPRGEPVESVYARSLMREWGVPPETIEIDDQSKTTQENLQQVVAYLERTGQRRNKVILVTSALHMPRAVALFKAANIDIAPASTDVMVTPENVPPIFGWLPTASALELTTRAWHELVGLWYYRMRGWTQP